MGVEVICSAIECVYNFDNFCTRGKIEMRIIRFDHEKEKSPECGTYRLEDGEESSKGHK